MQKGSSAGGRESPTRSVTCAPRRSSNGKMAENNVVFPRKLLKKFIILYKELSCLWDRKCTGYKHKKKRHDAITKLTDLVQKYDSTATRVHVLRKIESLRACVRREHKKVLESRAQARNRNEIYTPHLWYYDMLSFVFGEDGGNIKIKEGSPETASEDDIDVQDQEGSCQESHESYTDFNISSNMEETEESPTQKHLTYEEVKSKRHCTEVDDEYDAIGINVAAKLRGLPQNMRIMAEKLINDVLYQAQTNSLNSSTVINTSDPFKQDVL